MGARSVEMRHLRAALEFAVRFAAEGQKTRPAIPFPAALQRYFTQNRLASSALPAVKRAIDSDDDFRQRVASAAEHADLVDEVGMIWLVRGDHWEQRLLEAVDRAEAEERDADLQVELRRSEKRRVAAERATARAVADTSAVREQLADREQRIDELRSELDALGADLDALNAELIDARNAARHANDRAQAAADRADAAERARREASEAVDQARGVRDAALAERSETTAIQSELAQLAANAEALAARLASLTVGDDRVERRQRRALPMPGGVLGSSSQATHYLLTSGATVLVDGYNVAKLGWPQLDVTDQRRVLLDALENLSRRFGTDITVVFDGDAVTGASADRRRIVRVAFSPPGVTADDVIRAEVERLPASRAVVVVTNDQEILRDVTVNGANLLSSRQLLAAF